MEFVSKLAKMSSYIDEPVQYQLITENDFIKMNELIGREIKIEFQNQKFCVSCGNQFQDLYRMGFCKNCFFTKPEAGESIIRPELSKAQEGIEDRDLAFEKGYQLQPHIVYLANSGGVKVGVTREAQKTTRWTDQGASQAIVLAVTTNRYEAGLIEVALKEEVSDKTVWQRMLKNEDADADLLEEKERLSGLLNAELARFVSDDQTVYDLQFPVKNYPARVKGINLDKNPDVKAMLQGIRGQYLIFEGGGVLNVRGHSGYLVKISF